VAPPAGCAQPPAALNIRTAHRLNNRRCTAATQARREGEQQLPAEQVVDVERVGLAAGR
jgi:hypothetical protein